ncbi:hypothetical protein QQ054_32145 [Oscillatoria amoena NRMC-F 0135]|nr:hypothetical protein [Oscillatoria amoena NRMC-F 0135]
MQKPIISLTNALDVIYNTDRQGNPVPFSISFWTANERNQTGGDEITFNRAVLHIKIRGKSVNVAKAIKRRTRNPNHKANGTINIRQLGSDGITTIHPWLIKELNGKKVEWNNNF